MAFNTKLKELMELRNIKGADLSRSTGLSEAIISEYLKGRKEPRGKQSVLIAAALNVSLDELWETGFEQKEAPAGEQEHSEGVISLEQSNRLLVALGFIQDGEDLSDEDLTFLSSIIGILDAWFNRKRK